MQSWNHAHLKCEKYTLISQKLRKVRTRNRLITNYQVLKPTTHCWIICNKLALDTTRWTWNVQKHFDNAHFKNTAVPTLVLQWRVENPERIENESNVLIFLKICISNETWKQFPSNKTNWDQILNFENSILLQPTSTQNQSTKNLALAEQQQTCKFQNKQHKLVEMGDNDLGLVATHQHE